MTSRAVLPAYAVVGAVGKSALAKESTWGVGGLAAVTCTTVDATLQSVGYLHVAARTLTR